jgi:hypothetical protein
LQILSVVSFDFECDPDPICKFYQFGADYLVIIIVCLPHLNLNMIRKFCPNLGEISRKFSQNNKKIRKIRNNFSCGLL